MKEGARRKADEAVWRERGWDQRVCVLWGRRRRKRRVREWKEKGEGHRARGMAIQKERSLGFVWDVRQEKVKCCPACVELSYLGLWHRHASIGGGSSRTVVRSVSLVINMPFWLASVCSILLFFLFCAGIESKSGIAFEI